MFKFTKIGIIIFLVVFVFIFIIFTKEKFIENFEVDVVYTWVDNVDEERERYKKLFRLEERKEDQNLDSNRFLDNQELKYSLRSIDMYMPWVRKIFIVVKDGQMPSFINFTNPKIKLVNHSEFIPKKYLPTFNSITIEHFLYRIPNLAERYIYFNDDLMILKKVEKSYFFSANGNPKINFQKEYERYLKKIQNSYSFPQLRFNNMYQAKKIFHTNFDIKQPHTPSPSFIPWEREYDEILQSQPSFNITKFRENRNFSKNNLLQTYFYFTKGAEQVRWEEFYLELTKKNKDKHISIPFRKKFLCVNNVCEDCTENFLTLMRQLYPKKSQYEN